MEKKEKERKGWMLRSGSKPIGFKAEVVNRHSTSMQTLSTVNSVEFMVLVSTIEWIVRFWGHLKILFPSYPVTNKHAFVILLHTV